MSKLYTKWLTNLPTQMILFNTILLRANYMPFKHEQSNDEKKSKECGNIIF